MSKNTIAVEGTCKTHKVFAENLKRIRDERNLTRKQIAEQCGFSEGTLYAWERGTKTPRISDMESLANIYGIEVADFFRNPNTTEKRAYPPVSTCSEFVNHFYALASSNRVANVQVETSEHVNESLELMSRITFDIPMWSFTEDVDVIGDKKASSLRNACSNIALVLMADKKNGGLAEDCRAIVERYILLYGNSDIPTSLDPYYGEMIDRN